jgi:spore coat protein H
LKKYEIIINPKLLRQLNNDIWQEEHVPALLKVDDERYSIGIKYRGNVIRKQKKKSYHILFQKPHTVNGAHEIHLNAEYKDKSLSRNKLSLDFFNRIGVLAPHSQHVLLYINGICKGIYLELESFDEYLLKKRHLPDGPIIYATNYFANFSLLSPENKLKSKLREGYTIKSGPKQALDDLEQFIAMINSANNEKFEQEIDMWLDTDQYLKWLCGVVCTQNFDGFIHNYALYRNGETGRYEITPWDYDGTWGRDLHGKKLAYDFVPVTGYNTLTARLLHFPVIQKKYKDMLTLIFENDFTPKAQAAVIDSIIEKLSPNLHLDPFISISEKDLLQEKNYISQFINKRRTFLSEQLNKFSNEVYG